MELKEFQLNAVKSLFEAMEKPARDIILKSPTGSGKTIILTYFMHQYIQSIPKQFSYGSHRARVILKNKARKKWISTSMLRRRNSYPM